MPTVAVKIDPQTGRGARVVKNDMSDIKGAARDMEQSVIRSVKNIAATFAAGFSVQQALKEFAEFEAGLIGVGKTADLSGSQLRSLGQDIQVLARSPEYGTATNNLLGIAQAAGQLGVKGSENIVRFTGTVGKLGVASDLAGEEAATSLARILTVTGTAISDVDRLGSTIVQLGNNFAATESEIARAATRAAQATSQFDAGAANVAGIAAAMAALGVEAEAGGTQVGLAFQSINDALREGGDSMRLLEQITGQTGAALRQQFFNGESAAVFENFVQGLGRIRESGGDVGAALEAMGLEGVRAIQVIGTMATRTDVLSEALRMANEEWAANTALNREAEAAGKALANQWQATRNEITEIAVAFGEDLVPAAELGMRALREMASVLRSDEDASYALEVAMRAAALTAGTLLAVNLGRSAAAAIAASRAFGIMATSVQLLAVRGGAALVATQAMAGALAALPLAAVAAGIIGISLAWTQTRRAGREYREVIDGLTQALEDYNYQQEIQSAGGGRDAAVIVGAQRAQQQLNAALAEQARLLEQNEMAMTGAFGPEAMQTAISLTEAMNRKVERLRDLLDQVEEAGIDLGPPPGWLFAGEVEAALQAIVAGREAAATASAIADKEAVKSAQDYITALRETREEIGLNAQALRDLETQRAIAAAPDAYKAQIQSEHDLTEAALAAHDAKQRQLETLFQEIEFIGQRDAAAAQMLDQVQFENSLIGMNAVQRAEAVAILELENALIAEGTGIWNEYIEAKKRAAQESFDIQQAAAYLDILRAVNDRTRDAAREMAEAWGGVGEAIGGLSAVMSDYRLEQEELAQWHKTMTQRFAGDAETLAKIEIEHAQRSAAAQVSHYGDVAGAAKHFFDEQSDAYKTLEGIERAFRAFQMAQSVAAMAMDARETAVGIANAISRGTASAAAGAARIFEQLGVFGFPVVAAMVGTLAALGLKALGGGGGGAGSVQTAADVQASQGRGTVLGDAEAQSQSLANALDEAKRYRNADLEYSSAMVSSLRKIEGSIETVAAAIARQFNIPGGPFDTSGLGLGKTGSSLFGGIPILSGIFGSTKKTELVDQGIEFVSQTVADIIAGGIEGATYQITETTKKKKLFGITVGSSSSTFKDERELDDILGRQLGLLVADLRQGVLAAAGVLGIEGAEATLDSFRLNLGKLSLEGMTGAEIEEAVSAVFGAAADRMAAAVVPGLDRLQKAGEGLFETMVRVARQSEVVDTALESIGITLGGSGLARLEAQQRLVDRFGGADAFQDATAFFAENFLSEAERMAPIIASVQEEMARLNLSGVGSIETFKAVVQGLDLSTEAGADMYAALLEVAPAFKTVIDYLAEAGEVARTAAEEVEYLTAVRATQRQLDIRLADALGNSEQALAMRRADELAAAEELLRPTIAAIHAAEDLASARQRTVEASQALAVAEDAVAAARARVAELDPARQVQDLLSVADAERAVAEAQQGLDAAYQRQRDGIAANISALEQQQGVLRATADELRNLSASFSGFAAEIRGEITGAPGGRVTRESLSELAASGDFGAFQQAGRQFLESSLSSARTRVEFQRDQAFLANLADRTAADVASQASEAERSIIYLQRSAYYSQAQLAELETTGRSILTIEDAQKALVEAQQGLAEAQAREETLAQQAYDLARQELAEAIAARDIAAQVLSEAQANEVAAQQRLDQQLVLSTQAVDLQQARLAQARDLSAAEIAANAANTQALGSYLSGVFGGSGSVLTLPGDVSSPANVSIPSGQISTPAAAGNDNGEVVRQLRAIDRRLAQIEEHGRDTADETKKTANQLRQWSTGSALRTA